MKIKYQMILREIAGDYVLVPAGDAVLKYNGLFTMNEVGARIWELLPDAENEASIVKVLCDEYDITEADAASDTAEFIAKLREIGLI